MAKKKTFYITTTLPYVNSDPHVGFALELVQADVIARYQKLVGSNVFFNTGTDEHGQKIYEKAGKEGKDTQEYVDEYAAKFCNLEKTLGLDDSILHFVRTTDEHHKIAAKEFWRRCDANGDIYKKFYKVRYCIGCELEKTDSELKDGKCPLHPNQELEIREEENYFFRFKNYKKKLLDFYKKNPNFVVPDTRFNEIKAFIERGLEDFSISRLKEKMPWGISVPEDEGHVMYVWFDALINYISTTGWPEEQDFGGYWPGIQFAGKDQIRQQAAMWQAMLMSAGLPNSKQIVIHGFVTSGGQKMSKSIGNVIDPLEIVKDYGTEPLRYYLVHHVHPFEDSDFTMDRFKETYNANLANGLGNLVARIMKMAETYLSEPVDVSCVDTEGWKDSRSKPYNEAYEGFEFNKVADLIWKYIGETDEIIQGKQPFKLIKQNKNAAEKIIKELVGRLAVIALHVEPILPETARKIQEAIKKNKMPKTLFPRKD